MDIEENKNEYGRGVVQAPRVGQWVADDDM